MLSSNLGVGKSQRDKEGDWEREETFSSPRLFHYPNAYPMGLQLLPSPIPLRDKFKDGGHDVRNIKKQLSSAPKKYACIAG